jgi:hypothetical protein
MQEWLNWLVSKTSEPETVPRVRIPLSPPTIFTPQPRVILLNESFSVYPFGLLFFSCEVFG